MSSSLRMQNIVLAYTIAIAALVGLPLEAQQAKRSPRRKPNQVSPAFCDIWKSETTGREYRVQLDPERFYAEWVNLAPEVRRQGAYIHTECRRAGSKWVGTSRIYLPCTMGTGANEHIENRCPLLMRIEIDSITPNRITGRAETFKDFDCQTCKVSSTVWANFKWVPKR